MPQPMPALISSFTLQDPRAEDLSDRYQLILSSTAPFSGEGASTVFVLPPVILEGAVAFDPIVTTRAMHCLLERGVITGFRLISHTNCGPSSINERTDARLINLATPVLLITARRGPEAAEPGD